MILRRPVGFVIHSAATKPPHSSQAFAEVAQMESGLISAQRPRAPRQQSKQALTTKAFHGDLGKSFRKVSPEGNVGRFPYGEGGSNTHEGPREKKKPCKNAPLGVSVSFTRREGASSLPLSSWASSCPTFLARCPCASCSLCCSVRPDVPRCLADTPVLGYPSCPGGPHSLPAPRPGPSPRLRRAGGAEQTPRMAWVTKDHRPAEREGRV